MLGMRLSGRFLPIPSRASGEPSMAALVPSGEIMAPPRKPSFFTRVSVLSVARSSRYNELRVVGRFPGFESEVIMSIFVPSSVMPHAEVDEWPNVNCCVIPVARSYFMMEPRLRQPG